MIKGCGNVTLITNKPIPQPYQQAVEDALQHEPALFVVVGDLNLKGRYADSVAIFTKNKMIIQEK